jgi:hypothetical protein
MSMEEPRVHHRIYDYTSIGRPLDPTWPSNKAVLILVPLAAVVGFAHSLGGGAGFLAALNMAFIQAAAVFGTWALARELMPDDHVSAFISMALGFAATLVFTVPGLMVLFATLLLVRILNRSSGLAAQTLDSVAVTLLVIWAVYSSASPWFGAVGALAFFLDGVLYKPQKRQWWFALICLGSMVVFIVDHDVAWLGIKVPDSLLKWLAMLATLIFCLNLALLKKMHSRGDIGHARLDLRRVKAGMAIGLLAMLQGLEALPQVILLIATIGGLCIGIAFRRSFRNPVKGLRKTE